MPSIPTPIRKWIEQFASERGFFSSSSDVDHDATSNRTHDGDDIEPSSVTTDTLEANTELNGPTASEGDVVTLPSNPDVVPIFFDSQTGQPLVPDLEETV